jgi:hypothetical protein
MRWRECWYLGRTGRAKTRLRAGKRGWGRQRYALAVLAVSWTEAAIIVCIVILAVLVYAGHPRKKPRWVRLCRQCGLDNAADVQACVRCGGRLGRSDLAPRR